MICIGGTIVYRAADGRLDEGVALHIEPAGVAGVWRVWTYSLRPGTKFCTWVIAMDEPVEQPVVPATPAKKGKPRARRRQALRRSAR